LTYKGTALATAGVRVASCCEPRTCEIELLLCGADMSHGRRLPRAGERELIGGGHEESELSRAGRRSEHFFFSSADSARPTTRPTANEFMFTCSQKPSSTRHE